MAEVKISQLTSATTPLAGTEVVPIVQGGVTKKVAVSNFGGAAVNPTTNTFPYNNGGVFADSALKIYPDTMFGTGVPFGIFNLSNPVFGGSPNLLIDDYNQLYSFGSAYANAFGSRSAYQGLAINNGGAIIGCNISSPSFGVFNADGASALVRMGTQEGSSIGVDLANMAMYIGSSLSLFGSPTNPATPAKWITVSDESSNIYYLPLYQ